MRTAALCLMLFSSCFDGRTSDTPHQSELSAKSETDACVDRLPPTIARILLERFPDSKLPTTADSTALFVEDHRRSGGDGCIRVSSDDFNRDGKPDYAVVMNAKSIDGASHVVAVVSNGNAWQVDTLRSFSADERMDLYVAVAAPGEYRRSESVESDLMKGELAKMKAERPGIATGIVDAMEVVYFLTAEGWRHVWISE